MSYLLLPHLQVQTANTLHASFLAGGPPVMPAYFMAHALARKLGNLKVRGVALIHHDRELAGEWFFGKFSFQQRRGAAFTFTNKPKKDFSSKNEHALSLQPTTSVHLNVSLIVDIDLPRSMDRVSRFLSTGRFSGGQIISFGKPELLGFQDAINRVRTGYVVLDRRDLMETEEEGKDPAVSLVENLGASQPEKSPDSWLSAACLGYATLTPYAQRKGAREAYEHAFAEPLIGLVQYRSVRQAEIVPERIFWRPEWLSDDVFRLYQKKSTQQRNNHDPL